MDLPFTMWPLFRRVQWLSDGLSGLIDNCGLVLLRSLAYYTTSHRWPSALAERNVNVTSRHRYTREFASSFLPPANEVCEGYVFTGVCLSTGGLLCPGGLCPGRSLSGRPPYG